MKESKNQKFEPLTPEVLLPALGRLRQKQAREAEMQAVYKDVQALEKMWAEISSIDSPGSTITCLVIDIYRAALELFISLCERAELKIKDTRDKIKSLFEETEKLAADAKEEKQYYDERTEYKKATLRVINGVITTKDVITMLSVKKESAIEHTQAKADIMKGLNVRAEELRKLHPTDSKIQDEALQLNKFASRIGNEWRALTPSSKIIQELITFISSSSTPQLFS